MHILKGHKYTMNTAREHIERIISSYLSADQRFVLRSLKNSVERLIHSSGREGTFITEFINNADHAGSTRLRMELTGSCVNMINDGIPLSANDVDSLCMLGYSPKPCQDRHPYSGTGFKSVFMVSDHIELYSGGYRFMFSKTHWQHPENIPWQLIPLWIENQEQPLPEGFETLLRIDIKDPHIMERVCNSALNYEYIQPKTLLFLDNMETIEIKDYTSNTHRRIQKCLDRRTEDYAVYRIREFINGSEKPGEGWVVFTHMADVPEKVSKRLSPSDSVPLTQKQKIVLAFRLQGDGDLLTTGHGYSVGFPASLSQRTTMSKFNFIIQADFLPSPQQPDSVEDTSWNRWLCQEILHLLTRRCIPSFLKDKRWSKSFLEVLYGAEEVADRLLEDRINTPLRNYLAEEEVLCTLDGSFVRANDALLIMSSKIKELLSEEDLKSLYPDKRLLHPSLRIPYEIKRLIKEGPDYSDSYGANKELLKLLEARAARRDTDFFKRFYRHLSEFAEVLRNSHLKYSNIVLTENWELVDPGFAYINRASLSVPDKLENTVKIVHHELASDTVIRNTLELLGVEELTREYIEAMLQLKDRFKI